MRWWLVNQDRWARCGVLVFTALTSLVLPVSAWAQAQVGDGGGSLDLPFGGEPVLLPLFREAFKWGITIIVLAAAIYIAIGAYFYLAAAGNAKLAEQGKELITRAIMGLVLGLVGWIILNTINPQFAQQLHTPSPIPLTGGGAGG